MTAPLFWLTTCGHPLSAHAAERQATSDATAATVFRGERGIKAEVMSGPEEGEKAKAEMMAVKGPTVLVAAVAN